MKIVSFDIQKALQRCPTDGQFYGVVDHQRKVRSATIVLVPMDSFSVVTFQGNP